MLTKDPVKHPPTYSEPLDLWEICCPMVLYKKAKVIPPTPPSISGATVHLHFCWWGYHCSLFPGTMVASQLVVAASSHPAVWLVTIMSLLGCRCHVPLAGMPPTWGSLSPMLANNTHPLCAH